MMIIRHALAILLLLATRAAASPATNGDLTGTWTLVSVDNLLADGRTIEPYGPHPDGLLTLAADGHYSIQIFRAGRAPFASNDKARGTPEENEATVKGTNSHFGRWEVDAVQQLITFHIDHASFPNWEGTTQRRAFTLEGDLLRYTVRTTTTGGTELGEVTWRRARNPSTK